jgi:hypothetical protein
LLWPQCPTGIVVEISTLGVYRPPRRMIGTTAM